MAHVVEIVHNETTVELDLELHEVVTRDGMRLSLERRLPIGEAAGRSRRIPVLLLHGFGQCRHTWYLSRRSFPAFLVSAGFEVYTGEFRGHGLSRDLGSTLPRSFRDLVDRDLPAMVNYVLDLSQASRLILVGHSLGGVVSFTAGPGVADRLAGVAAIASPAVMAAGPGKLRPLAAVLRPILGGVRRGGFPLKAGGRIMERLIPVLDSKRWYSPMGHWYPGSIERDLIRELTLHGYQTEGLGLFADMLRWIGAGGPMGESEPELLERAARTSYPALILAGDRDRLVPPDAVRGWLTALGAHPKHYRVCGRGDVHFGHMDVVIGRHAPDEVWPLVLSWLDDTTQPLRLTG